AARHDGGAAAAGHAGDRQGAAVGHLDVAGGAGRRQAADGGIDVIAGADAGPGRRRGGVGGQVVGGAVVVVDGARRRQGGGGSRRQGAGADVAGGEVAVGDGAARGQGHVGRGGDQVNGQAVGVAQGGIGRTVDGDVVAEVVAGVVQDDVVGASGQAGQARHA